MNEWVKVLLQKRKIKESAWWFDETRGEEGFHNNCKGECAGRGRRKRHSKKLVKERINNLVGHRKTLWERR